MQEHSVDSLLSTWVEGKNRQERIKADLDQIRKKDLETYSHSLRTTFLAVDLAKFLGLDPSVFVYAGLVHDYGKTKVPDRVLKKVGRFKEKDYVSMRRHPVDSFEHMRKRDLLAALIAGMHHMHNAKAYPPSLNLHKYPDSEKLEEKAWEYSKVLAIADFWDAAVNRTNSRFGRASINLDFIKKEMIRGLPKLGGLINRLFDEGVFSEEMVRVAQERRILLRAAKAQIRIKELANTKRGYKAKTKRVVFRKR